MKEISSAKTIIQKSKFFGHLFEIEAEKEIPEVVDFMNYNYKKSKHICYAALIGEEEIIKNDGEVGSPGKVLLQILKDNKLNNHILIVARIFGGIKLGVGGVSRAFREIGRDCSNLE